MPPHDETTPVGPAGGPPRRPPAGRTPAAGGAGGRARTNASRSGGSVGSRPGGSRPTGSRPAGGKPGSKKARSTKQRRRRRLKVALGTLLGLFLLLGVFVGVVYATTEVPDPGSVQNSQTTVVYYADGTTEMARLGDTNRTNVGLAEVSEAARDAVLAAENRNFYSDPGISFTGIVRAAWNNLTGGSTQGGSTITQQYVKNAFLTADQTFSRKFQELFLAVKLDNEYSKDEILENYLNTIYFGRGAYGIEAAANTFFGVPAAQLTPQQGAVLAVQIRSPSSYDPEANPEGAQDRWGLVLDAMVEEGWMTQADRDASVYPPVQPRPESSALGIPTGPEGLVVSQAISELEGRGYSDEQIRAGGLRITTTVDKPTQDAALAAVAEVMDGQPDNLRQALVAVDPRTGGVRAYYGGDVGAGDDAIDYAQARRQPGSSMKPYVLATALDQGISVTSRRDGSSPQEFPDRPGLPVRNSGGTSCPACSLVEAMTRSLNTTYYGLAYEVGPENVRETALAATGMPDTWPATGVSSLDDKPTLADPETGSTGSSIGIGQYEMRPIDQATGFATFASGGVRHDAHFVSRVTDTAGAVLLDNGAPAGEQVMSEQVASDTTYALEGVAQYSRRALDDDREVAAKTGTQGIDADDNSDAWMVGYTPSLSTAVWMGSDGYQPIRNDDGAIVYGSGLPGAIWQQFMDTVLDGTPEEDLPDRPVIRGDTGEGVPEPVTEPAAPTTQSAPPTQSAPTTQPAPSTPATPTETVPGPGTPVDPNSGNGGNADPNAPVPPVPNPVPQQPPNGPVTGGTTAPVPPDPGTGQPQQPGQPAPTTQPQPQPVG
ncbi:transglycosylase domain-containing protein [Geodermatophilus amargosae]|uniref:transglycosylase domain-containing protein n=1 Tax=Geodermatophilus amargosae TaxID=1296565 RepID=UPI0034DFB540